MGNKASTVLKFISTNCESRSENEQAVNSETSKLHKMEWPFSALLPKPLEVGNKIILRGKIASDAEIFTVNLVCEYEGSKPYTVAYHHKVMFEDGTTVLNSKINGHWREEVYINERYVEPGDDFTLTLLILDTNTVRAYYSNIHHSDFTVEDVNIEDIKYLQIWHGLEKIYYMKVEFEHVEDE